MYQFWLGGILLPVTPGALTIKINDKDKTITMIDEGEVSILKTPGLSDITIPELLLPTQRYPFVQSEAEIRPAYYLDKFEAWKVKRKPVQFKVLRYEANTQELLWDTDMYVTLGSYEIREDVDKYGKDVCVKLPMKEWKPWGAKELVIKKKKSGKKKAKASVKKKRRTTKSVAKTYTVKAGDTLLKIAKKQLNDSSLYKKLYELNKNTIEAAAKKHGRRSSSNGWWIYAGTVLKLPGGSS